MARLSALAKDQLTPEFADLTEQAAASGQATVFEVLGHRPDMVQSYFSMGPTMTFFAPCGPSFRMRRFWNWA